MTRRRTVAGAPLKGLEPIFAAIREANGISAKRPATVEADVAKAAKLADVESPGERRNDAVDVSFVTLDPVGSMDLDQAFHLEALKDGWRLLYAIADVGAHVVPGSSIDKDAWKRAETTYCPDMRVGLHPQAMSEGFASLLPGQRRKAVVWDLTVDSAGALVTSSLSRAWVRSTRRFSYDEVRAGVPDGAAIAAELARFGDARRAYLRANGAVTLPQPSQEVTVQDGLLHLELRAAVGIEDDNAQLSLLTGIAAAGLMIEAGVGILRTMPPADTEATTRLRRQAAAIGVRWPEEATYGEVLESIDPATAQGAAFVHAATGLFRGAQWQGFDASHGVPVPEQPLHGALASPYAHVTAPLRRLVDRYGTEACLAHVEGRRIPEWVTAALPTIGEAMAAGTRVSRQVDRLCIDAVEAAVLAPHVGETFTAVGLDGRTVQLTDPAIVARCDGDVRVGVRQDVTLVSADPHEGARFRAA